MDIKNTRMVGKHHCPECNCMYIRIDNEIVSCPGCELSSKGNRSIINEEECQERISSISDLNFNKSSCS